MDWIPPCGLYIGERKLQIIHTDDGMSVVDKETQQTIDGVYEVTVNRRSGSVSGEIIIKITDPEDIVFVSNVVEGSVVPAYPQLPESKE